MSDQSVQEAVPRRRSKGMAFLVVAAVIIPAGFWLTDAVQRARWAAQRSSDK